MKRTIATFIWTGFLASAAGALQVTPTYQIFTVKAGSKVTGRATVSNNDGEKLNVDLHSKDWFILKENSAFKAKDWLTFPEPSFTLEPGASRVVNFEVEAPKKAEGELVGMMSYSFSGDTPTNVQRVLSMAIYCAVDKTEKLDGRLKQMMITLSTGVFNVSALVENTGNVHIRPTGFCEIKDAKGETAANVFLDQSAPIYPGKEAVCVGKVKDLQLKAGEYKALLQISDVDRKADVIKVTKKFELLGNNTVDMK